MAALHCWCRLDTSTLFGERNQGERAFLLQEQNLFSNNGRFSLNMLRNGNLVLYSLHQRYVTEVHYKSAQTEIWRSGRDGHVYQQNFTCFVDKSGTERKLFIVQGDNNVCIYAGGSVLWARYDGLEIQHIAGPVHLILHDHGNLVLYDKNNEILWEAK